MEQNLRFKPGDKVVVRPDLDIHIRYQALTGQNAGWGIAPSLVMTLLAGQEFEVRSYSYSQKTLKLKGEIIMEKNLFEIATRNRYRFNYKGVMTVEDLWSLRVEDLDAIFKMLNRQKKTADEDSLLATKSAEDQDLANKIDIVRYIVSVKLAEAAERVSAAEKKAQRDKIMEIVAKKKDKALEDMGIEDLMKKLEELN